MQTSDADAKEPAPRERRSPGEGRAGLGSLLWALMAWTLTLGLLAVWRFEEGRREALDLARVVARESYAKDLLYRRWAAGHGGVYAPITETTPPNPYLTEVPERDITTPSGRQLTLVNPAYMTRQVFDLAREAGGTISHITSLNPIRPENAPDAWERRALEAFASGETEVSSVEMVNGEPRLRLMQPLRTEASCLRCHAAQGYREGDLRGGISVAIALAPYMAIAEVSTRSEVIRTGVVWLIGCGVITALFWVIRRRAEERGQAETTLQQREAYQRAIINNLPFMLWLKDTAGRFLAVNNLFAASCGEPSADAVVGKTDLDVWPRELAESYRADDRRVMESGEKTLVEEPISQGGRQEIFETFKTPVHDRRGSLLGTVGFARNVTERRATEEELRQAQKMESVGRLAGGVAHDFNNMLQAILGNVEIALSRVSAGDALQGDLLEIQRAASRSADLTRQLLAFSRRQTVSPQVIDLNSTVRGLEKMLRRLIGEDITLNLALAEDLWSVRIDPSQMDQVLTNLVVNARDAIPGPGVISIETRNIPGEEGGLSGDGHVLMTVSDTGVGMAAGVLTHAFEPFYTTKGVGQGTGLGLATVHGIVTQNGGKVDIVSAIGQGTAVRISLPRAHEASPSPPPQVVPAGSPRGSERILLVEDEPQVMELATRALERCGYRVLAARTPAEALRLAEIHRDRIDLVISDVVMPEMSGPELLARLRAEHPGVRCLLMSGYAADVIRERGIDCQQTSLLQKPFTVEALAAKIRDVLSA